MHPSKQATWHAAAVRRSTTIIAYLREHQLLRTELITALDDVLEKVRVHGDDRGFVELLENLQHMHACLPEPHLDALCGRLDPADHQTLRDRPDRRRKELARVLRRGAIVTDDEYHTVLDRVDDLSQEARPAPEIDRLNALLADFDRRADERKDR